MGNSTTSFDYDYYSSDYYSFGNDTKATINDALKNVSVAIGKEVADVALALGLANDSKANKSVIRNVSTLLVDALLDGTEEPSKGKDDSSTAHAKATVYSNLGIG